ncbi:universal stress protein [Streptomyces sp. NPDC004675]|uniref:universal stress protein n=1 Tax=Streptomyces sp. NPDC004675 TaxID=3154286 RepID=UPI0033B7DD74
MDSPAQQRIVVGVSGSLNSLVALQRAGTEARLTGRRLLAVLAWRPCDTDPPPGTNRPPLKGTRTAAVRLLKGVLNDVFAATDGTVRISGLVISGSAGRTLVQIANKETDLLVIGRRHHSKLRRWRSPTPAIASPTLPPPSSPSPRPRSSSTLRPSPARNNF